MLGVAAAASIATGAQQRAPQYQIEALSDRTGVAGLSLALRRLGTVATLMQTTAHPDDENNALLALYARGHGMRVALVTATRGDGGQNEIGPELFDALGILRTEELLAAHRWDGAEQYFTRAVDFGYSFSPEETMEKWGRQEIIGDFVRMIRTIRPDVIVTLPPEGTGGGQHHQASAVLTRAAFRAAADPAQFPEQIAQGLQPWQGSKLYQMAGFGGPFGGFGPVGPSTPLRAGRPGAPQRRPQEVSSDATIATIDTSAYDPLLGCTIGEIGAVAAGMHICQGRAPVVPLPGPSSATYRLVDSMLHPSALENARRGPRLPASPNRSETSLFDGIDTSLAALARLAGQRPPEGLVTGLTAIAQRVDAASRALDTRGPEATIPDLLTGLAAVRDLRGRLETLVPDQAVRYEIDFRLEPKEKQFQQAIVFAHALRIDALADDGLVIAGQPVNVSVFVANRGADDLSVKTVALEGFEGRAGCLANRVTPAAPFTCAATVRVPQRARLTAPYWIRPDDAGRATLEPDAPFGLPFRPTPFRARVELDVAGTLVVHEMPVRYRYEGHGFAGEKRTELKVVPAFSVRVSPDIVVIPLRSAQARELRVRVVNGAKGSATGTLAMKAPPGWRVTPASAPLTFTREDESITTRFTVAPPAPVAVGEVGVSAEMTAGTEKYSVGYEVVEYPHTQKRHKLFPAAARLKVIDVSIAPDLSVGYIMGVGDQVPPAIQQLGARLELIDADELAWGDLSQYDTIVTGVRAYERRDDLRANNHRLLKYVENGGTVIVQYNKGEFNQAQYAPYAAKVSSNRITDEHAPVKILVPDHPIFTFPNRIGPAAWEGWVQERGLYFLGEHDPKIVELVEIEDPFPYNTGAKHGALVEARHGKGRWVYVGLGLWRQLPAGTDGAYQILANLISLGRGVSQRSKVKGQR
jgi:LmbE family N-acetylglucosaminyl deacetylase